MSLSSKRKPSLESMHCAVVTERLITFSLRLRVLSEWSLGARGYPSTLSRPCLVPPGGGLLQQEKMTFVLLSGLEHWVRQRKATAVGSLLFEQLLPIARIRSIQTALGSLFPKLLEISSLG